MRNVHVHDAVGTCKDKQDLLVLVTAREATSGWSSTVQNRSLQVLRVEGAPARCWHCCCGLLGSASQAEPHKPRHHRVQGAGPTSRPVSSDRGLFRPSQCCYRLQPPIGIGSAEVVGCLPHQQHQTAPATMQAVWTALMRPVAPLPQEAPARRPSLRAGHDAQRGLCLRRARPLVALQRRQRRQLARTGGADGLGGGLPACRLLGTASSGRLGAVPLSAS